MAEYLRILQVPIGNVDGFIRIFWRLRPDSPGAVASWRHEEEIFPLSHGASRPEGSEAQSVVRSCLPPGGFICACHS